MLDRSASTPRAPRRGRERRCSGSRVSSGVLNPQVSVGQDLLVAAAEGVADFEVGLDMAGRDATILEFRHTKDPSAVRAHEHVAVPSGTVARTDELLAE